MSEVKAAVIDEELLPFLSLTSKPQVRCIGMQYFLGLTGSDEGRALLKSDDKYITAIIELLKDKEVLIQKDAYLALVNLCAIPEISVQIVNMESNSKFLQNMLEYVLEKDSEWADIGCTILSNISHLPTCAHKIVNIMLDNEHIGFEKLINIFCQMNHNKKNNLHYLGPFLSNLTQIQIARLAIMNRNRCIFQRLLPYLDYKESVTRRGGVVGTIRNCCFETSECIFILLV